MEKVYSVNNHIARFQGPSVRDVQSGRNLRQVRDTCRHATPLIGLLEIVWDILNNCGYCCGLEPIHFYLFFHERLLIVVVCPLRARAPLFE